MASKDSEIIDAEARKMIDAEARMDVIAAVEAAVRALRRALIETPGTRYEDARAGSSDLQYLGRLVIGVSPYILRGPHRRGFAANTMLIRGRLYSGCMVGYAGSTQD